MKTIFGFLDYIGSVPHIFLFICFMGKFTDHFILSEFMAILTATFELSKLSAEFAKNVHLSISLFRSGRIWLALFSFSPKLYR